MEGRILAIPGLPHDDRHLSHRNLAAEAPVREHHHVDVQRRGSSSWTCESKRRFRTHNANSRKSSTRTRTTEFFYSEERENKAKTIRRRIASEIRMDESELEGLFRAIFFLFIIFTKIGGNANVNIKTLNGVDTKTPNGQITSGTHGRIMIGVLFQLAAGNCCSTPTNKITNGKIVNGESVAVLLFEKFRVQTLANVAHAT